MMRVEWLNVEDAWSLACMVGRGNIVTVMWKMMLRVVWYVDVAIAPSHVRLR